MVADIGGPYALEMLRSRPVAVAVFAMWTLVVWGNRVSNVLRDPDLDGAGRATALVLPAIFLVVGVLAAAAVVAPVAESTARRLVGVAVASTVVVWCVRAPMIALADHDLPFVVVHVVLAAVSIALGWWAWVAVTRWADCAAATADRPAATVR